MARPDEALAAGPTDGTLQAFFDTMVPGKPVPELLTELGNPIDPKAIAGVDSEHGAVYTDALLLARNPRIGFTALEPAFIADLSARSLAEGADFLDLDYEARERVCLAGLDFANGDRIVWEAAAAVPFTAFCAAANVVNATRRRRPATRSWAIQAPRRMATSTSPTARPSTTAAPSGEPRVMALLQTPAPPEAKPRRWPGIGA